MEFHMFEPWPHGAEWGHNILRTNTCIEEIFKDLVVRRNRVRRVKIYKASFWDSENLIMSKS
jgi:hypothetical protein